MFSSNSPSEYINQSLKLSSFKMESQCKVPVLSKSSLSMKCPSYILEFMPHDLQASTTGGGFPRKASPSDEPPEQRTNAK